VGLVELSNLLSVRIEYFFWNEIQIVLRNIFLNSALCTRWTSFDAVEPDMRSRSLIENHGIAVLLASPALIPQLPARID